LEEACGVGFSGHMSHPPTARRAAVDARRRVVLVFMRLGRGMKG
jgi:hypothetical protein